MNQPPLAWITGAAGLIGNYLVNTTPAGTWRVRGLTRVDLDLLDFRSVRALFEHERPRLVIHCAALSQSPACQANPELARKLNVHATQWLAELSADIPLVFFSTDLIFDGRKGNYVETDAPNPLSVYAETKVAAEQIVLRNPKHLVIRTSLNGGTSPSRNRGFNEQLRQSFASGSVVRLFADEFRSPIPAEITARAVWELVNWDATGIFHVAGTERLSRWEIGQLVAQRWPGLNAKLQRESLKNYSGAPRSPDTSLDSSKAQALLSFRIPGLTDWLKANLATEF